MIVKTHCKQEMIFAMYNLQSCNSNDWYKINQENMWKKRDTVVWCFFYFVYKYQIVMIVFRFKKLKIIVDVTILIKHE